MSTLPKGERWDRHFLHVAETHARMSKDPSTKVGAVIVGPDFELLSAGFNGFPRGVADTAERLNHRETKYGLIVHGEMNAILAAARHGIRLKGSTLYIVATDCSGRIWGGPPCLRCTVEAIQAGIEHIVSVRSDKGPSERWIKSCNEALEILNEVEVTYREIAFNAPAEASPTADSSRRVLLGDLQRSGIPQLVWPKVAAPKP